jgi:hypothetical protein
MLKMPFTRRQLPVAAAGVAAALGNVAGIAKAALPHGESYGNVGQAQDCKPGQGFNQAPSQVQGPVMSRWAAVRKILANKEDYDKAESWAYEYNRMIHEIPLDLMIKKSFSPMAKVTFARQRLVAREMAQVLNGADRNSFSGSVLDALQDKMKQLMFPWDGTA